MARFATEKAKAGAARFLRAMSKDPMVRASDDLYAALRPFADQRVGGACCEGLTTTDHCCRCGPILRAQAALAKAEGRLP